MRLEHDRLDSQRRNHPAWRLLIAENGPLILLLLSEVLADPSVRSMPGAQLAGHLQDHLEARRASRHRVEPGRLT